MPADNLTLGLETAGLNTMELSAYCRKRGLYPEPVGRWRQAPQDVNAPPLVTNSEQKDLEQADQREIKRLQQELRHQGKALAEAAALQ